MKHSYVLFFLVLFLSCCIGCSKQGNTETEESSSGENDSISTWKRLDTDKRNMFAPVLIGDVLYYWNGDWNRDEQRWSNTSIYRQRRGEENSEEVAALNETQLLYFLIDEEHNLYYLYGEYTQNGQKFFFRKDSVEGAVQYDIAVSASEEEMQKLSNVAQGDYFTQGTVSRKGEACFYNPRGELFLFDGNGNFLGICSVGANTENNSNAVCGLVNSGDEGVFFYAAQESRVLLQRINFADVSLETMIEVPVESKVSLEVYDGYDRGILISDSSTLWEYHLSEKKMNKILEWGNDTLNLIEYEISALSMAEDECLYVLTHRPYGQESLVRIAFLEESNIPEKQVVLLAMYKHETWRDITYLETMAEEFNKYNGEYRIEIKPYSGLEEFYNDLLKGNAADIFEMSSIDKYILEDKGVLENLSPYFERSVVVKESDLLPAVRSAGYVEGKYVFMFPRFNVTGYLVAQGTTHEGGWTPEEYVSLGEIYTDSRMGYAAEPVSILRNILLTDSESFINWQDMECYFDDDRFISLLERIVRIGETENSITPLEYRKNAYQWLHDKELLTDTFRISSASEYIDYRYAYGDFAEFAGHPNQSGKLYYRMEPCEILGMNSASKVKDGVWAFMEYLLSRENQNQIPSSIPIHKESFETWLSPDEIVSRAERNKKSQPGNYIYMNLFSFEKSEKLPEMTDTDKEFLRNMVANLYWNDTVNGKDISNIIFEEAGAFFAGDKTAKEAAEIIQNRVALLLNE